MKKAIHLGHVDLTNQTDFQFLYGSQLYGTLFGVYGRFTANKETDEDSKTVYYIEKIEFKTINYKGILDINIVDIDRVYYLPREDKDYKMVIASLEKEEEEETDTVAVFRIEVQAHHTSDKNLLTKHYLNENGGSTNGLRIKQNQLIHFDRRLKPIHEPKKALHDNIFDTEFYFREGLSDEHGNYKERTPKPLEMKDMGASIQISHSSGICPRSTLKAF